MKNEKKQYEKPNLNGVGNDNGELDNGDLNHVAGGAYCGSGGSPGSSSCGDGTNADNGGNCEYGENVSDNCNGGTGTGAW